MLWPLAPARERDVSNRWEMELQLVRQVICVPILFPFSSKHYSIYGLLLGRLYDQLNVYAHHYMYYVHILPVYEY
jgi:hypothetical protein